jgi:acetyl-CoA carboxylase biotin carboxyl carrier protein
MPAYLTSQVGVTLGDDAGDRLRDILAMVEESDVDEVVIEQGDLKMTVRKAGVGAPQPAAEAEPAATLAAAASSADGAGDNGFRVMRSKWVATFYRAPSPQAANFVEVGDSVTAGQTLCILEMMKMMNELTAEVAGVVREILVENGETVQYGQPLFSIEPA